MFLDHAMVLDHLSYCQETGIFTRKKQTGPRTQPGVIAGTPHNRGYVFIGLFGKKILAHRLAWFYMTGVWPAHGIDHINRDKADNRWRNLREATQSQNTENRSPNKHKRNPELPMGVLKCGSRFIARIGVQGKKIYLGSYATEQLAIEARLQAKAAQHKFNPTQNL